MRAPAHHCPICGRPAPLTPAAPSGERDPRRSPFPFCSPACKLVDLGRWLDGSYRVPGPPVDDGGYAREGGLGPQAPRESSFDGDAGDGE